MGGAPPLPLDSAARVPKKGVFYPLFDRDPGPFLAPFWPVRGPLLGLKRPTQNPGYRTYLEGHFQIAGTFPGNGPSPG